jgi:sugar/nucleoside kinase (ribokinase family)
MSKTFVSVGVTILDIVGYPISALPEGESTELIQQIHICPAGTAAAPAVVAARQGLATHLAGAVGNDDMGRFLLDKLARDGVDTSLVQVRDDMPTAATILPINESGGRPNWHAPGAFLLLEPTAEVRAGIAGADHIHWGGVGMLFNMEGEVAASILGAARSNGAVVTADLIAPGEHSHDSVAAIAAQLDYFMPSIDEALEISGRDDVEAAADYFMAMGAGGCVIKCGAEGAFIANQAGIREQVPVIADVNVVDTSGCGDSFCGGFNVGLANDMDPVQACHFAAATAAQVASGMGSNAGVRDFETTLRIMQAGSMTILEEDAG